MRGLAAIAGVAFILAACGGDDDGADTSIPAGDAAQADATEGPLDQDGGDVRSVLGYRITGPAGAAVEVDGLVGDSSVSDDLSEDTGQPISRTHTLDGTSAAGMAFNNVFDVAELEVVVTAGGPVTIEGFRASIDFDSPLSEAELLTDLAVDESLVMLEVSSGAPQTVSLP